MLGWLFGRSRRLEVFGFRPPGHRRFRFWDPVAVKRALVEHGGESWADLVDAVYRGAKPLPAGAEVSDAMLAARRASQDAATHDLGELVAKAFGVSPLSPDGSGWTENDRIELMAAFLVWCTDVIEATRPLGLGRGVRAPAAAPDPDGGSRAEPEPAPAPAAGG